MMKEYRTFIGWGVAAVVAMLAIWFLTSCKSTHEIEKVYVHDTLCMTNVVHDSVDRWHTHYEYLRGDTFHIIDTIYMNHTQRVHDTVVDVQREVQYRDVAKEVEKKVYLWWPGVVAFFALVALAIAGGFVVGKVLKKIDLDEEKENE